jgi:hypothetical protein
LSPEGRQTLGQILSTLESRYDNSSLDPRQPRIISPCFA